MTDPLRFRRTPVAVYNYAEFNQTEEGIEWTLYAIDVLDTRNRETFAFGIAPTREKAEEEYTAARIRFSGGGVAHDSD